MPPKAKDLAKNTALGLKVDKRLKAEIVQSFELYRLCRAQEMMIVEVNSPDGKRATKKFVAHTTGLSILPAPGGVLEQPYRLMEFFSHFIEGDRQATFLNISRT